MGEEGGNFSTTCREERGKGVQASQKKLSEFGEGDQTHYKKRIKRGGVYRRVGGGSDKSARGRGEGLSCKDHHDEGVNVRDKKKIVVATMAHVLLSAQRLGMHKKKTGNSLLIRGAD